jgi:hypothetical protein
MALWSSIQVLIVQIKHRDHERWVVFPTFYYHTLWSSFLMYYYSVQLQGPEAVYPIHEVT